MITQDTHTATISLQLDLKRGELTGLGKYGIDEAIPAWLWLEIGRNYPQLLQGDDIEIEFDVECDIESDNTLGSSYADAENPRYIEGSGTITGETDSIKIEGDWELAGEIAGVWEYEVTNEVLDNYL